MRELMDVSTDMLQHMLQALAELRMDHHGAVFNRTNFSEYRSKRNLRCKLCVFDGLFGDDDCSVCPWVIFTGYTCQFVAYNNDRASFIRIGDWQEKIRDELYRRAGVKR